MYRSWMNMVLAALLCVAQPVAAQSLQTAAAQEEEAVAERLFDAVIEAVSESTVSAQTSGRIEKIHYDVDDFVAKGSEIIRLRDKEQQARHKQARAGVGEARAGLDMARQEFDRVADVFKRKLVAKAEFDKAEAALKGAQARLEAAQARLSEAAEQLAHTVIKAPYSGVVTKRHVEVGESVNPGQALMDGYSYEHLRAIVHIPQAFAKTVRRDGQARILLSDTESLAPESIRIFPYADRQGHAFKVRLTLPVGDHGLYPGMFVKVAFATGQAKRLIVPASAVVFRSELSALYVVADGKVALRQVRLGRRLNDRWEVLAGLDAGEQVALDPIAAGIQLKQQR